MGTKINPGKFDCYAAALPDEPMFVLLARDPDFERLVRSWATRRQADCFNGDRPMSDNALVEEACDVAVCGARWRRNNMGKWRNRHEPSIMQRTTPTPDERAAIDNLRRSFEWRSPNDQVQSTLAIKRELAEYILAYIDRQMA